MERTNKLKISKITKRMITEITPERLKSMPKEELYKFARQAVTMAKRTVTEYKKYRERNPDSIKSIAFKEWNDKFSSNRTYTGYLDFNYHIDKNMSINQLRFQLRMARDLLKTKTATKKGREEVLKDFANRIGEKTAIDIKSSDYDLLWSVYRNVEKMANISDKSTYDSKQAQKDIYNAMTKLGIRDKEDLLNYILEKSRQDYERVKLEDYEDDIDPLELGEY